jgi:methyltransferase (TIGR00027 family)
MGKKNIARPESTAVRVALWRALHLEVDPLPHLIEDKIGLKLADPKEGWRNRPDMKGPAVTRYRAGIVIRARFVEDLLAEQAERGISQYIILGAGLDTFAQRRPELGSRLQIFEVDQPGPQAWKRQRLIELGYGIAERLHLVPVDFEIDDAWVVHLTAAGFDATKPAVVAAAGVSMYLTEDAIVSTLQQVASLAPGSTFVMTFLLPPQPVKRNKSTERSKREQPTRSNRKPFISFFTPQKMLDMARKAGFREARHLSGATLTQRYLSDRLDSLPQSSAEEMLVATT